MAAVALPLSAQSPPRVVDSARYDVTIGLTIGQTADVNKRPTCTNLELPCETRGPQFPNFGLALEGAFHPTPFVALVAEASLYSNSWDTTAAGGGTTRRSNYVPAALGGARLSTRGLYPFTGTNYDPLFLYAQLLTGPEGSSVAPMRMALQPGIGMYAALRPRSSGRKGTDAKFRLAWDYRWTRGQPRNLSGERFVLGVTICK